MRSRMDTHPPLRHFVTVRNRPWFGTHADHIKTSKCSKPKLLSCWFLWSFRVSTESCCVNCLHVQILAFCRLRGTDYNVSLQCNQTLEPAGDRKLNNFNSVIKNLVPEYFKPYCIFFYTARLVTCDKLDKITTKKRFWESEKINFKFLRNWENTGKIVMRKITFCEIWSFWSLFCQPPIRTFSLDLFHVTSSCINSPWKV